MTDDLLWRLWRDECQAAADAIRAGKLREASDALDRADAVSAKIAIQEHRRADGRLDAPTWASKLAHLFENLD
jgi:hypothetical protein